MTIDAGNAISDLHRIVTIGLSGWIAWFHLKENNRKEENKAIEKRINLLENKIVSRAEHDQFSKNIEDSFSRMEDFVKDTFTRMEKNMDRQEASLTTAIRDAMTSLRNEFSGLR